MANTKTCSNCCEAKPLGDFYLRPNGLPRSLCKRCYNTLCNSRRHRPWTAEEDAAIREFYPKGGYSACKLDRAKMAIQQRAHKLRVAAENYVKRDARVKFGLPVDTRPESDRALDLALRSFRVCEPAANLTWILGDVA